MLWIFIRKILKAIHYKYPLQSNLHLEKEGRFDRYVHLKVSFLRCWLSLFSFMDVDRCVHPAASGVQLISVMDWVVVRFLQVVAVWLPCMGNVLLKFDVPSLYVIIDMLLKLYYCWQLFPSIQYSVILSSNFEDVVSMVSSMAYSSELIILGQVWQGGKSTQFIFISTNALRSY